MFRFIFRQRRRLAFGWFFLFLTVWILFFQNLYAPLEGAVLPWFYWPAVLIASVLLTGAAMVPFALALPFLPRWRHLVEMVFFMTFLEVSLSPSLRIVEILNLPTGFESLTWFVTFMAVYSITYGVTLDRFRIGLDWESTRSFKTNRTPSDLWPAFALSEETAGKHWDPLLHEVQHDADDPTILNVLYTHGSSFYQHQTQTILETIPNEKFRYHYMGDVDPANQSLTEGVFGFDIQKSSKGGSKVTVSQNRSSMLPREAIGAWFDDELGDKLDSYKSRLHETRDWSIAGLIRKQILGFS